MKQLLFSLLLVVGLSASAWAQAEHPSELTAHELEIGTAINGYLVTSSDQLMMSENVVKYVEVFSVDIQSRLEYEFTLGGAFDTYLYLLNENYQFLEASDDDEDVSDEFDGFMSHSRITRTLAPGTYYLIVTSYNQVGDDVNSITGPFTITAATTTDQYGVYLSDIPYDYIDLDEMPLSVSGSMEDATIMNVSDDAVYVKYYKLWSHKPLSSARISIEGESVLGAIIYNYTNHNHRLNTKRLLQRDEMDFVINVENEDEILIGVISEQQEGDFTISAESSGFATSPETSGYIVVDDITSAINGILDLQSFKSCHNMFDSLFYVGYTIPTEAGKIYKFNITVDPNMVSATGFDGEWYERFTNDEGNDVFVGNGSNYYILLGAPLVYIEDNGDQIDFTITITEQQPEVCYIDAVNGDDNNDGLSPQTPVATLSKAINIADGLGTYFFMSDYTVTENIGNRLGLYAEFLPYNSNITLTTTEYGFGNHWDTYIAIGDKSGDFRFDITSTGNKPQDWIRIYYGNLYMYNTRIISDVSTRVLIESGNGTAYISNCFLGNRTLNGAIIDGGDGNLSVENCSLSDNPHVYAAITWTNGIVTLINDTIKNNETGLPSISIFDMDRNTYSRLYIDGGVIENNRSSQDFAAMVGAGAMTTRQCGSLMLSGDIEFEAGPRFAMSASDFVLLGNGAAINFFQEPDAEKVCTIVPIVYDEFDAENTYINYEEGLNVVNVGAEYSSHVVVAQLDINNTWYISEEGNLTTTNPDPEPGPGPDPEPEPIPEGIASIETAAVSLYPNPATTVVNVDLSALPEARSIRILSMMGQTLMEQSATTSIIDLASLPAGIYLLQVADNEGRPIAARRFAKR